MIKQRIPGLARLAAIGGSVLAAAGCSPPGMLNWLDSVTPGSTNAARVATGVAYGPAHLQKLDVWAPILIAPRPLPVVIFYYGGAWTSGSRQEYGFVGRALASEGFVAVIPDYRHVPGVQFPAFVQDGASAIKWTRDHIADYGGDPKRITLSGHSAGAYIAGMLALNGQYLKDIGVDPHIVRAAAPLAGPYDFYPWDDSRAVAAFANWPRPAETQPISYASRQSPPMLLAYGSADTVVKPRNSIHLAARLRALGAPVTLREYPGKSHNDLVMGLSKPFRGKASTLRDATDFLREHSR